jgi:hypothetical protein
MKEVESEYAEEEPREAAKAYQDGPNEQERLNDRVEIIKEMPESQVEEDHHQRSTSPEF